MEPMNNVPAWQFNTLPGNANQGAILMTRNDITLPPFNQDNFIWKAMEDVIGVADMKLEYDEENNLYSLYKAKGHQDNEGKWTYSYELVGTFHELTEAVEEALENMEYVSYTFDTTTEHGKLIIKGVKKDGTEVELARVSTGETMYSDSPLEIYRDADNHLKIKLNYDTTQFETINNGLHIKDEFTVGKMTYKGEVQTRADLPTTGKQGDVYWVNERSDFHINIAENGYTPDWLPSTIINNVYTSGAIRLSQDSNGNGLKADLLVNDETFTIIGNRLNSLLINDNLGEADPGAGLHTYSIPKLYQLFTSVMRYKGQVSTYNNLPTIGNVTGDCWNVVDTGDNYAWNGTGWDKLSGEYVAGAGITITGKTISATGISFIVGNGLEATGSGSTTTLKTKNGNGISYDTYGAITVQKGSGITVNSNGVNVNTGNTTQTVNDNLEVKPHTGLVNSADGLNINANFDISTNPLGNNSSNITLYSDNKIGIPIKDGQFITLADESASINTAGHTINLSDSINNYTLILVEIGDASTGRGIFIVNKNANSPSKNIALSVDIISAIGQGSISGPAFWAKTFQTLYFASDTSINCSNSVWWFPVGSAEINPVSVKRVLGIKL